MAEERRVGVHPGKAFAEVREKGHACHHIRSKIQEAEAEGVHMSLKKSKKGGQSPQEI